MITGIAHAAFGVADLDRTLDFYCRGLGMREAFRLYGDNGELRIVYVQVAGLDFIEFFPRRPGAGAAGTPTSYRHLALAVDDMEATVAVLAARGIAVENPPKQGRDHNWQAWVVDPDGNRLELMQVMDDSPQAEAARAHPE